MQFHTENEILMWLPTIITLLFMQYILYCMTKLYITNDDSSQAPFIQLISLHHVTSTLYSWNAKAKIAFIVIHDSTSVISHTGNSESLSIYFHLLFFHSLCCQHCAISKYSMIHTGSITYILCTIITAI